ncbi:hypothetical protein GQ53DRAFT_842431 [Thozetella sp. PMI_491]|nr:hypothetical protein GQ53DRAFT_842431 [Thozetella sp. PMI_491]
MKQDRYLNLCLEQATLSPLRYRHGCIVVKGGKVIGRGFNDFRPGYEANTVKSGRWRSGPGDSISRACRTSKPKPTRDCNSTVSDTNETTHAPMQSQPAIMCTGPGANTPLSLHSEMMAINSALASSNPQTTAFGSRAKLLTSGAHALKAQKRAPTGLPPSPRAKSGVFNQPHVKRPRGQRVKAQQRHHHYHRSLRDNARSEVVNKRKRNRATQHRNQSLPPEARSSVDDNFLAEETTSPDYTREQLRPTAVGARDRNKKQWHDAKIPHSSNKSLIPEMIQYRACSTAERMKHPKLVGADVYVVRMANFTSDGTADLEPSLVGVTNGGVEATAPTNLTSAGSLHEQLRCKDPESNKTAPRPSHSTFYARALESRPCYRCVCYMHSVGIKRVFWTNSEGSWENAKIRDLVDMLNGNGPCNTTTAEESVADLGVFVTKHEVLRLRRSFRDSE